MHPNTTNNSPAEENCEQRQHLRFDKIFPVRIESILFGEFQAIARNVSAGGIFVELHDPLPIGAKVRVSFMNPQQTIEISALGEVKNHYFINYSQNGDLHSISGMAIKFEKFDSEDRAALEDCLNRFRVLN